MACRSPGRRDAPDCEKLRLSDMFEVEIPRGEFEWTATALNINYGRNKRLMEQCKDLRDYSMYVKLVQDNREKYGDASQAVTAAVNQAIRLGLLDGYFKKCKEDAIMDCLSVFDEESFKKVMYENGYDDGIAEGRAEGREQGRAESQARIAELEARIAELEAAAK